jgi:hypothetical protein
MTCRIYLLLLALLQLEEEFLTFCLEHNLQQIHALIMASQLVAQTQVKHMFVNPANRMCLAALSIVKILAARFLVQDHVQQLKTMFVTALQQVSGHVKFKQVVALAIKSAKIGDILQALVEEEAVAIYPEAKQALAKMDARHMRNVVVRALARGEQVEELIKLL